MSGDSMEKLLEIENVTKSYAGVQVLKNVNITLSMGEVLCFVGENGAGKSTLIKIIAGDIQASGGVVRYFGKEYENTSPKQITDMGVSTIYQDIDLVDNLTVSDNVFLGCEMRNKAGFINTKEQEKKTDSLIEKLHLNEIKGSDMLTELSTAQKQCVQIVKALHNNAKILILDEPTASLGDKEKKSLLALVKELASQGIGIIYISHFIEELFEIGDTFLILKDGEQVTVRRKEDTTPDQIIHDMIGRDASNFYKREYFEIGKRVLKIKHYDNRKTVQDVTLEIKSGEVFGLGGLIGAGRTELARMIYGLDKKKKGHLYIDAKEITPKAPKDALNKGIFMISEDRKGEGLLMARSVKENIMITHNEKHEIINLKKEKEITDKNISAYRVKTVDRDTLISNLSGGNQQKTIIARCTIDDGEVYIFDEPTKGVDIGAKEEIYEHILNLAKKDKFVILISSDMPELLSMSDRIGVMCSGKLVEVVNSQETSEDKLMKKYLGY